MDWQRWCEHSPPPQLLSTELPREENQLQSTICQLPLETFNSNKIYESIFLRILPVRFISRKVVVNATIVSWFDLWANPFTRALEYKY